MAEGGPLIVPSDQLLPTEDGEGPTGCIFRSLELHCQAQFASQESTLDSRACHHHLTLALHMCRLREAAIPTMQRLTTTVSTKGQVVLPKVIRQSLRWDAGTRLVVESTPEGVLLKPEPVFAATRPEDVYGCLSFDGPPKTLSEMEAGILAEAKRRHAGD